MEHMPVGPFLSPSHTSITGIAAVMKQKTHEDLLLLDFRPRTTAKGPATLGLKSGSDQIE